MASSTGSCDESFPAARERTVRGALRHATDILPWDELTSAAVTLTVAVDEPAVRAGGGSLVLESFLAELRAQVRRARDELGEAARTGDDFLAEATSARLDQLGRLATDHGLQC